MGWGLCLCPKEVINGAVGYVAHVHTYNYDFLGYPSP